MPSQTAAPNWQSNPPNECWKVTLVTMENWRMIKWQGPCYNTITHLSQMVYSAQHNYFSVDRWLIFSLSTPDLINYTHTGDVKSTNTKPPEPSITQNSPQDTTEAHATYLPCQRAKQSVYSPQQRSAGIALEVSLKNFPIDDTRYDFTTTATLLSATDAS